MTLNNTYLVPTRNHVESLTVGSMALNCFGKFVEIVEIFGKGNDLNGKAYVCFYGKNGPNSTMSASYKEDELVRTVALSGEHSSHELDNIEKWMVANGIEQFEYSY